MGFLFSVDQKGPESPLFNNFLQRKRERWDIK